MSLSFLANLRSSSTISLTSCSNDILGKSIVAVIYKNYRTSLHALDYVTKVDKFGLKDRIVNKWLGAIIMRMVGKSRAKLFDEPPRENLLTQLNLIL